MSRRFIHLGCVQSCCMLESQPALPCSSGSGFLANLVSKGSSWMKLPSALSFMRNRNPSKASFVDGGNKKGGSADGSRKGGGDADYIIDRPSADGQPSGPLGGDAGASVHATLGSLPGAVPSSVTAQDNELIFLGLRVSFAYLQASMSP